MCGLSRISSVPSFSYMAFPLEDPFYLSSMWHMFIFRTEFTPDYVHFLNTILTLPLKLKVTAVKLKMNLQELSLTLKFPLLITGTIF